MLIRSALGVADKRRIQEMLFANNGGSGLRQALLDGAPFLAELTHSLVLARGTGSPTFTRATTETGQRWDEAGYLDFTALAGEIVFKGARRVRNLVATTSRDFTNAAWTSLGTPTAAMDAVGPFGDVNGACTITDAEAGQTSSKNQTITVNAGSKLVFSAFVRKESNKTSYAAISLRHNVAATKISAAIVDQVAGTVFGIVTDGGVFETPVATSIEDYSTDYWRVSVTGIQAGATLTAIVSVDPAYSTNGTTFSAAALGTAVFADAQLEDVTGQTTQTASEYVSVGVESAPIYHGSMVDGVKCYDTDRSGNPISTSGSYPLVGYVPWEARTNLCLQSNAFTTTWTANGTPAATQNAIGPDGGTTAWTLTDNDAGIPEHLISGSITLTAAAYTYSLFAEKTAGATTFPVMWFIDVAGTTLSLATLDTNAGAATVWASNGYGLSQMASASARCTSHNDLFWRFELTATGTAAAYTVKFGPALSNTANKSSGTFDAAQGSAVFYGAQVELGSFATPYIPTTTVAVARNADLLTYTGADVANIKTLAATFSRGVGVATTGVILVADNGTTTTRSISYLGSATDHRFDGLVGGATSWDVITSNPYVPGATSKIAWSVATNDIKMDKDGVAQTRDTSATVPSVTQLDVGHMVGTLVLNGPVNHIYGWTRNLSQSELGAIDA